VRARRKVTRITHVSSWLTFTPNELATGAGTAGVLAFDPLRERVESETMRAVRVTMSPEQRVPTQAVVKYGKLRFQADREFTSREQ